MRGLRAIPRRLLGETCSVRQRLEDGSFGAARTIRHVRFEYKQSLTPADKHRLADAGAGVLFVDATNSAGAFELCAGDRVELAGVSYVVASVKRYCGMNGRVHHWEVGLK